MKRAILPVVLMVLILGTAHAGGEKEPRWFNGNRLVQSMSIEFAYPVESVFPLLCPVREYDWMASWNGTIVYTNSGFAEKYTVFYHSIPFPLVFKKAYWTATGYVPNETIQWCVVVPGVCMIVIDERMTNLPEGRSRIDYVYTITGVSRFGNSIIGKMFSKENLIKETQRTRQEIEHYLATGTMLSARYKSDMFN